MQGILIGVIAGLLVAGGVALAYVVPKIDPSPTDRYYACVSAAGKVKPATMKLNVEPTGCPIATDTIRSWNAQGPQGDPGPAGSPGVSPAAVFQVRKSAAQSYAAGPFLSNGAGPAVFVKVTFDVEDSDSDGAYDPTTGRFTAPSGGTYTFGANLMTSVTGSGSHELVLAVNGGLHSRLDKHYQAAGTDLETLTGTSLQTLAAGDIVEVWLYSTAPGAEVVAGTANNAFFGYRLAD